MQSIKKIVFVMPWHISERGGGAEVQANYLAQELAERGHVVSYICQTTNSKKINTVEKIEKINVHYLKPSGRFQWQDQNKYLKPLKTIQPDYILQRLSSNVTYVLGKYSSKSNCKLIWFCTDNKSPFSDYHFSKFKERASLKSLGFLKYNIFAMSNKLMDFYRNHGMKQVGIAFSQNDFQRENIKINFNLESFRMISGHPNPKKEITAKERFKKQTVLWCANFGQHKRPELFVELVKQFKNSNINFIMVGGHSDTNYVTNILKDKPKNLITTGPISFEAALSYFDEAAVFVNTSTPGGDGFPNTFVQSWLRGVPVISLGFDPDNIIENNKLGFNVHSINDAKLKLMELLININLYKSLSTNAFNYGSKNHSIEIMTNQFLKKTL